MVVREAQQAGYRVTLHVVVVPEVVTVARVARIRARYRRPWPLVVQARTLADQCFVYDNSTAAAALRLIASYERGVLLGTAAWPRWTPAELL